ncbi:hypothetical protein [Ornithinibacillus xuwenensis]|uniref:Lipoprotein n=1 Tax=Ornithinibacillus xuwenensis TaxID=3144668 RepID=A0ABU9XG23_9BACI
MKKRLIFLLFVLVLLLTACNNDELSGKTFNLSTRGGPDSNPDQYHSIMTLEFSDGKVETSSINDGEGTYELNDDKLAIHFENENENLTIEFTVEESDKEFSEYSAVISDYDFEMSNTDKVSHYKNIINKLHKDMSYEFIKE